MKQSLYLTSFTFLGLLIATLVHAALEFPTLHLITGNLDRYGESFLWRHWAALHSTVGALLWLLGALLGYGLGRRYWRILYVEARYGAPRW